MPGALNGGGWAHSNLPGQQGVQGGPGGFNLGPQAPTGGGYQQQPLNVNVQDNPQLKALYGSMQDYHGQLAAGNDQDAQLAMQRQRDMGSGAAREMGMTNGMGRGAGISQSLRQKAVMGAQQNASGLSANLTSDARRQQQGMLGLESNLAQGTAANQLGQQHLALDAWRARDTSSQSAAQMYNTMQQQNLDNQLKALQNGGFMGNTGGGSGGVYGTQYGVAYGGNQNGPNYSGYPV